MIFDAYYDNVSFGGFDLFTAGTYDLFNFATGHSGNFASVTFGGGALTYDSGLALWSGTNGSFDYSFTPATGDLSIAAVPEPTTWGLLAMSLTIVVIFRRRSGHGCERVHI
ncbi:MAG: PEP-CTERM sorting domain-containing protein [Terrimicrobiaceae bacterium]